MRSQEEVELVLALCREGLTTSEIARRSAIPRSTAKDWRAGRIPQRQHLECPGHDVALLDHRAYAYVLGMYLGDGCISAHPKGGFRLRITLDSVYPAIVSECIRAIEHHRPIELTDWQHQIVADYAEAFLRGLIHSDGTRIIATERKGSYVRRAPRYVFSNRSEDILELFRHACEIAGVHCTRSSRVQVSVYSKAAVARMGEFVGPKR